MYLQMKNERKLNNTNVVEKHDGEEEEKSQLQGTRQIVAFRVNTIVCHDECDGAMQARRSGNMMGNVLTSCEDM